MIEIQNVNFRYSGGRDEAGLRNITLTVPDGEVLLVCGGSGCGKSTLTRLVNGLIPHFYDGELSGKVTVNGVDIAEAPLYDTARIVGSVFQNPRSQFFNVDTTSELAFSCENTGMPEPEVRSRMEKAVGELNLRTLLDRSIFELSGGEKQRIACGSVSTLSPAVMVLDEPTSNLDFPGIESLRKIIEMWKAQGRTVIVAEHRLHFLRGVADRVIYMDSGEIREQFSGAEFFAKSAGFFEQRGLRVPELTRVFDREFPEHKPTGTFALRDLSCSYKSGVTALDIPEAALPLGSVIAIASVLASGREFIVFDEPTSGLDAGHMQQAAECILRLKEQGRNVMIVTHDPEFIACCCDYAVRIECGRISEQYAIDRSGREKLREFFIGGA